MLPSPIVHADWGSSPQKRWMARAALRADRYHASAPEPVGDLESLLERLHDEAGPDGCVLAGFDFPIGLPSAYAARAGITSFLDALQRFGEPEWADFYRVAERPEQISPRRPFYPARSGRKGEARLEHLLAGLGLEQARDLRRVCERAHAGRRAAAPLFWTVGGQQVGKAAITGWRDVLAPALRSGTLDLAIWPFSGPLFELFRPGRVVVAETYPAEFYAHLGVKFAPPRPGRKSGKRAQADRAANAPALRDSAEKDGVVLDADLQGPITGGFGSSAGGEDRFDAVVGLFGMLHVVLGRQPEGGHADEHIRTVEGWILGQPT